MMMLNSSMRFIIPYPKDGGSDKRMRLLLKYLAAELGIGIDVENYSGAAAGHEKIAEAGTDARTLGMISNEVGMMHWLARSKVEPRMFTGLALPFVEAAALVVSANSSLKTVEDLRVKISRERVVGTGSPDYGIWKLALVGLLNNMGVPQRNLAWLSTVSGEEGLERVIGGEADVAPVSLVEAPELIAEGKVRALATMGETRHPKFPDVPTIAEAIGIHWVMATWRGVAGPAGLDTQEAGRLECALKAVSLNKSFRDECEREGYMVDWKFGREFETFMAEDDRRFGELFKSNEIRAGMVGH